MGKDEMGKAVLPLVFCQHILNTTGSMESWAWPPSGLGGGVRAGHGTPESEKVAFDEKPTVNSIWTVSKGHAAVRECQDFESSISKTQNNRCPFQNPSSRVGSKEEKGGFLSNFIHSRLVLCHS